jgi:tetratricopeptide (TPR) repeat protein
MVLPPNPSSIGTKPEIATGTAPVGSLPVTTAGTTPSPLVLQMEVAIAEGSLVSPAGSSAWDLYQRLTAMEPPATELPHLKSKLIEALMSRSKAIVAGDVRSDNISSNVDDFRLAGQMLTRLKGFEPDNADINRLQKLSAAEALIALQFYDEAAKALEPLRTPPTGWVENALGLASVGQLSDFEAERHFKHAIEFDPKWAAPHYNLALLYRNQKKEASLAELEQAARLDGSNPAILAALGDEYFERKQWGEAASAYRGAVTASPGDDALHTKLGHALYSQGMRAEADKEYQKAKELANTRK